LATAKSKARHKPAPAAAPSAPAATAAFLAAIGREVRRNRAKRGMTRRQLAQASETSERYLAQIESGAGNPSVSVLRAIALALELPIVALLPDAAAPQAGLGAILDLLAQVPESEVPALTKLIEARIAQPEHADQARRIALVGLRGAGKSTLGRKLAEHLGWPFIELDRVVEEDYGARIPDLIEMAGIATFRRQERSALERVIAKNESAVITTAGGIVSSRAPRITWVASWRRAISAPWRRTAPPWPISSPSWMRGAPIMPARKPSSIRRATRWNKAPPSCYGWSRICWD
jgi:XRE family transcriptional regulator, aerobic/anaerobic benzoate catabolism transcriptional regulator